MKIFLVSLLIVSILFLILDGIWLSFSIKNFYKPNLVSIPLNDKPVLWAAIFFYVIYVFGLTILIVKPALDHNSVYLALWTGFIFGFVAYGTYNLTNMAFIKNWSVYIVFVDMIWGGFASASASALAVYFIKNFFN